LMYAAHVGYYPPYKKSLADRRVFIPMTTDQDIENVIQTFNGYKIKFPLKNATSAVNIRKIFDTDSSFTT